MQDAVKSFLAGQGLADEIVAFIISMLPIFECRGGLIWSYFKDIPFIRAFIICLIGNILPLPFILLFIDKIFNFMKKHNILKGLVLWLEGRALRKSESVKRNWLIGLFVFVAIPLPGTGGWTGALIASVLRLPIKKSFLACALGVLGAAVIVSVIFYGFFDIVPDLIKNILA